MGVDDGRGDSKDKPDYRIDGETETKKDQEAAS